VSVLPFRLEPRRIEDELLDHLAPDDPRAVASRRDLVVLNRMLGNTRGIAHSLQELARVRRPGRVIEMGSGDCRSSVRLLELLGAQWKGCAYVAVDRVAAVQEGTRREIGALGWRSDIVTSDVFDWLEGDALKAGDAVVASLFLHHFDEAAVRRIMQAVARREAALICAEPRRWKPALWGSQCFGLLGFSGVTRHDAVVSVRAGFADGELRSLWPMDSGWTVSEHGSWRGVVHFSAVPKSGTG